MLTLALVLTAFAADAKHGAEVYAANCIACHGKSGDGKGPAAQAMRPPPPSFRAAEWWNGMTDDRIKSLVKNGTPGTPMVSFSRLSAEELDDLVAYLRTWSNK